MNEILETWWKSAVKPLQESVSNAISELDQIKEEMARNGKDTCDTVLYQKIESTHQSLKNLQQDKLFDDQDQLLQGLQENIEIAGKEREQRAITSAITRLVEKLLENDGANILELGLDLSRSAASSGAAPAVGQTAAPVVEISPEDMPWIESNECTSCDDCTTINRSIFTYDDKDLAYIKDPRGGPFRDIVKAAEKCPSDIIHPGKPLNPKEKDLDKWVKRAAKYQ